MQGWVELIWMISPPQATFLAALPTGTAWRVAIGERKAPKLSSFACNQTAHSHWRCAWPLRFVSSSVLGCCLLHIKSGWCCTPSESLCPAHCLGVLVAGYLINRWWPGAVIRYNNCISYCIRRISSWLLMRWSLHDSIILMHSMWGCPWRHEPGHYRWCRM